MKKYLLLFLFLGVFTCTLSAQDKESDVIKNNPVLLDSGSILSQLKEQLGVQLKTQLKEQFETQVKTGFDSLSRKELNHAIDSMVLMLDEVIKQSKDVSMDSLDVVYNALSNFNFKLNDQDASTGTLLKKEDLLEFYESFTSQSVKTRKELLSIRRIWNRDKKARRLSESLVNYMNESGFWEIMEKMLDNMFGNMMPTSK
ncbi:MAG: hypothetical protein WC914_06885 [Proteiniphilum sp.]